MSRAKLRALEETGRVARAQLEETMADSCGNLKGPLPTLREIAAEDADCASEVFGHARDLIQDVKAWRKADALLYAKEEINAARHRRRAA